MGLKARASTKTYAVVCQPWGTRQGYDGYSLHIAPEGADVYRAKYIANRRQRGEHVFLSPILGPYPCLVNANIYNKVQQGTDEGVTGSLYITRTTISTEDHGTQPPQSALSHQKNPRSPSLADPEAEVH